MLRPIRFQYAESEFHLDSLVHTNRPTVEHGVYSVPTCAKFDLCRTCRNVNYCLTRGVSVHLWEFVVNKVELEQRFLRVFHFSPVKMLNTHISFTYHRRHIILANNRVVQYNTSPVLCKTFHSHPRPISCLCQIRITTQVEQVNSTVNRLKNEFLQYTGWYG